MAHTNTHPIQLAAIRKRLTHLDKACKECYMAEPERITTLYSATVTMWTAFNLYVQVGYSAHEWFSLEYPIHTRKVSK